METESNTLKELAKVKAQATAQVKGAKADDEETDLPPGNAPAEPVVEAAAPVEGEEEVVAPVVEIKKEKIKIGSQEFDSQEEAIAYAEKLEYDKLVADAYSQGVKDSQPAAPVVPPEPEFDETEFFTNPAATLAKVTAKAKQEAIAEINQATERENHWKVFFEKNPDLSGDRQLCEYVLQKEWNTIGTVTDIDKGMQLLAQKTRAIFQGYQERQKPKKELPSTTPAQVVSSGQSTTPNVTPKKDVAAATNFAAELKSMRKK